MEYSLCMVSLRDDLRAHNVHRQATSLLGQRDYTLRKETLQN